MPKLVSELAQGNAFSRSADGGQLADTATRVFKIILDSPGESIDIMAAVGVQIGDPYSSGNPIPCVSVEGRADGESRLVRIVTAQYRTSPMVDGEGGTGLPDPMLVMPDVRPANFSTSTSLYEMPATRWCEAPGNTWTPVHNPVGDLLDGVGELAPITTIRVTQFNYLPGTVFSQHVGKVNDEAMNLGSFLSCGRRTVMFRGVEAQPHVETFGITVYRGFMNSYEFAYRPHFVDGFGEVGWDMLVPLSGFNVKAFNPGAPPANADPWGQPLRHEDGKVVPPLLLPEQTDAGDRVRAMVKIMDTQNKGTSQNPSAQPVPLNADGTPRITSADPKVLIKQYQVQTAINLTNTLALRIT
jgi:hypothetical protein